MKRFIAIIMIAVACFFTVGNFATYAGEGSVPVDEDVDVP